MIEAAERGEVVLPRPWLCDSPECFGIMKNCVTMVMCDAIAKWRTQTLESNTYRLWKAVVWFASEIAFVCNIALAAIEFVVRVALSLLVVLPLWLCGCLKDDSYDLIQKFPVGACTTLFWGVGMSLRQAICNLNPWYQLT